MNICFYTHAMPVPTIGGVERVTYNLCRAFRDRGLNVFNLCSHGKNADALIPQNVSDEEKSAFVNRFLHDNNIAILIDQYGESYLTHPAIDRDIRLIRCFHTHPYQKHLTRSLLEVVSYHNPGYSMQSIAFALNGLRRSMRNRKYYACLRDNHAVDRLVFLCDEYARGIGRRYNIPDNLLAAIPNAAGDEVYSGDHTDSNTIIWCGRMAQNPKNIFALPRIWRKLSQSHPDWQMVLVGDGIDRPLLERRIRKYKLQRITITGNANPFPYYDSSRIFAFPSYSEGFGMVLLEAMAHGCVPVVFDNSAAFHDIIDNEVNGMIVPDLDENAFVDACRKMMDDENLRLQMAEEARKKVAVFSMDNICNRWLNLFNSL
ncbi:MAG: glycosyltransferase [Muribaculaceae bacterium]|nr:glycosyltransferase [Muribaculaceae bacterium]